MSDLAKDLLTQYYGLGAETSGLRFVSIHQSIGNINKEEQKQVIEQTSLTIREKSVSDEESQKYIDDERKYSLTSEFIPRSPSMLNSLKDEYDPTENFDVLNIDFGPNIICDVFECESSVQREEWLHDTVQNTPRSIIENQGIEVSDVKDFNGENINLKLIEDNIPDNVSEASSKLAKKSQKSSDSNIHLPALAPKKEPVFNETFADVSNNDLKRFPKEILINFPYLRMLYLSHNNLTELSDEVFSTLKYLEWLDVRNNQLSSLPFTIKSHTCLETILLQGNKLENLPPELCTLPNLNTLQVTQNPLITPPEDIVASGSTVILEYLRIVWNNIHPEERIESKKNEIKPKLSTILCYQSPRKNKRRTLKDNYHNRVISTRDRRKPYKPSNRCENKGSNYLMENRVLWYSKAKEFFAKQAAMVQRMKDENVLKDWRQDKRSYSKAMEKAMKRNEDDIPFGFDLEDYPSIFQQNTKLKNVGVRKKNREKFRPPADINKKINELLDSLNKIEITTAGEKTPRTKQSFFKEEIAKILQYQSEIQNLQKYNDIAMVPSKN